MSQWRAKRFYTEAHAKEAKDGFVISLDGRALKTPAESPFALASKKLAEAIAAEWNAQAETIEPETMPMARLAATVIDRVVPRRADMVQVTVMFGETDLLCYRAEEPAELAARQQALWQPILDWAAESMGARMAVTVGVIPVNQPAEASAALRRAVEALDDFELAGVAALAAAAKSLLLALALHRGRLDGAGVAERALVEDSHRLEKWGEDLEARAHLDRITAEIGEVERFLALL